MGGWRRRLAWGLAAVAALVGAGIGGWLWWTEWRFLESTDDAYVQADIAVISAKVVGYVRELRVVDNQPVRAGEVLVVLDDQDYRAHVDQGAAAVEAQRAAEVSNDARLELQSAMIAEAEANVAAAEAEQHRAGLELERVRSLTTGAWATRERLETTQADQAKAVAALARARAALVAERDQVTILQAARHEIDAQLHQAQAQLALARVDLDNTVIRAPVAGVVGNRSVQLGLLARSGVQLMSLVPLDDLHVDANFKETQLQRMRPGQSAVVSVDAFPDRPLSVRVTSLSPASGSRFSLLPPENATGNFTKIVQRVPVRIDLPAGNPLTGLLRPGMSVVVTVDTRGAPGTGAVVP
jgi:membrane fusion protein (multidrug efflux system)